MVASPAGATPVFTAGLAMLLLKLPRGVHRGTERGVAQEWRGAPGREIWGHGHGFSRFSDAKLEVF